MAGEHEGHLHANIFLLYGGNGGYEQFQEFASEIFFTKNDFKIIFSKSSSVNGIAVTGNLMTLPSAYF